MIQSPVHISFKKLSKLSNKRVNRNFMKYLLEFEPFYGFRLDVFLSREK